MKLDSAVALVLAFGTATFVSTQTVPSPQAPAAAQSPDGPSVAFGRNRRPPLDEAAVKRGAALFAPNCGFCHGSDARGGPQGPDLARSTVVLADVDGKQFGEFIEVGRPAKGMPAFKDLKPDQVSDIAIFLRAATISANSRIQGPPLNIIVGDPKAGQAFFEGAGKCNTCHSTIGDLKGIGLKYDPILLQDKFISPRFAGRPAYGLAHGPDSIPRTLKVITKSGKTYEGKLVFLSDFVATLIDKDGNRHSFARNGNEPKVVVIDPVQFHQDMLTKYTDEEIHNLTAYLVTVK